MQQACGPTAFPQTHLCKTLTLTSPGASRPHTELPRPHTGPWTHAHKKGVTRMHMQVKHTYNNGSECTQTHLPYPRETPQHRPLPLNLPSWQTWPRLAPSVLSPLWPKTGPALPAPACLGGALPAPNASCQLSTGHSALCCWLPFLHVASSTPSS